MRTLLSIVGVLTGLSFMVASAAMNATFMKGLSQDELQSQVYAMVAIAVTISIGLLPFFTAWLWRERMVIASAASGVTFVVFLGFSFLAGVGFASSTRDLTTGSVEANQLRFQGVKEDLATAQQNRKAIGSVEAVSTIEAELSALRKHRRFSSSKGCTNATASRSREFCAGYESKRAELGTAIKAEKIGQEITRLRTLHDQLLAAGALKEADPQAKLVAVMTGVSFEHAQRGLIIFMAVLVELGAAFLLFVSTAHWRGGAQPVKTAARQTSTRTIDAEIIEPANEPPRLRSFIRERGLLAANG